MSATVRPVTALPQGDAFEVTGEEAYAVATLVRFIDSINAGDFATASSAFTAESSVSDCDFASRSVIQFDGRDASIKWLSDRIRDHENCVIGTIFNHNPPFDGVLGVTFAGRTSDTLARLGASAGIKPLAAAKVVLGSDRSKIVTFAAGPGGADPGIVRQFCSAGA